ncbi:hypothetical protein FPQ18DRAFT_34436 [Pyronema domesticum]|nr:hypothetical protein FPQ18DRAFT_34436 [Pyronema domesticum]
MGCCGGSRKPEIVIAEHKFAYVNLADFKSKSWINYSAYFWIYMGTLISIACYAADIYTAVILLAFNRWTNDTLEKTSLIDFDVAKIIFSVCIFFSFILLAIDWFFAVKIIKSDGVAEAYMNVIALRYNCIWGGKGTGDSGWKRFLVFSRLTSQRGMVDYIALFTYFAFKGWVRILFAEGPRVVINALVFISVTKADVIVNNGNKGALAGFDKFGKNVQHLYNENKMQVMILGTMAFTSLMWILAIIRLLVAGIVYICYLWHAMSGKQSLQKYCKDRIDTRMGEIVQKKHDKALKKEKEQRKTFLERQPTIPVLANLDSKPKPLLRYSADSQGSQTNLIPQSTATPPPSYALNREPTLPIIAEGPRQPRPMPPSRTATTRTNSSSNTQSSRGQNDYFDSRRQEPYSAIGGTPGRYQSQSSQHGDAYQMQPLAPARGNNGYGPGIPQGRFPVAPREPPPAAMAGMGMPAGYAGGPRSQTAGPTSGPYGVQRNNTSAFGPPPRANTAGPMGGYGPPPNRAPTAGPGAGPYGPPSRTNTATPGAGPYCTPQDDYYGGSNITPVSGPYGTPQDDYYGTPARSNTATPGAGPYGRPKRTNTFGDDDSYSGYEVAGSCISAPVAGHCPPPRAATANPFTPSRSQTAGPQNDPYAAPIRSNTTGPSAAYGPPPRSLTAGPQEPVRTNTTGPSSAGAYGAPRILTPGPQHEDEGSYYTASPSSYYTNTTPTTGTVLPPPRSATGRPTETPTPDPLALTRTNSEESSFSGSGRGTHTASSNAAPHFSPPPRSLTAGPGMGGYTAPAYGKQTYQPSRAKGDRVLPEDSTRTGGGGLSADLDEFGPPRRAATTPSAVPVESSASAMATASAAVAAANHSAAEVDRQRGYDGSYPGMH